MLIELYALNFNFKYIFVEKIDLVYSKPWNRPSFPTATCDRSWKQFLISLESCHLCQQ